MRKALLGLALTIGAAAVSFTQTTTQTTTPRSIWEGAYTPEQAKRGEAFYPDGCARCHGDELEGDEAPALRSEEFLTDWKGMTLGALFSRIRTSMPGDSPGSLTAEETADVIAYIFSRNNIPPGRTPMNTNVAALRQIRMDK